jgi:hypothetical protein
MKKLTGLALAGLLLAGSLLFGVSSASAKLIPPDPHKPTTTVVTP